MGKENGRRSYFDVHELITSLANGREPEIGEIRVGQFYQYQVTIEFIPEDDTEDARLIWKLKEVSEPRKEVIYMGTSYSAQNVCDQVNIKLSDINYLADSN